MRVNLCCGDNVWNGWICCDPRGQIDDRIKKWQWGDKIPVEYGTIEVITVSYGFMYAEKENYFKLLKDCFNCLKLGGCLIIREDDNTKRIWRKPGTKHFTGIIKSNSNKEEMVELLSLVGFSIIEYNIPEEYKQYFVGHRSASKKSYCLTAYK